MKYLSTATNIVGLKPLVAPNIALFSINMGNATVKYAPFPQIQRL